MDVPFPITPGSAGDLSSRFTLPAPPAEPAPYSFPLVATLAPVIGSVLIWAITRSPFALVFALLGPIVAIASLGDSVLHGRRRRRKDRMRFEADLERTRRDIRERHARERAALEAVNPQIQVALAAPSGPPRDDSTIRVGGGEVRSALEIDGVGPPAGGDDASRRIDAVRVVAARLDDAPIVVDARRGLGIWGPAPAVDAVARACVVRLAGQSDPSSTVVRWTAGAGWDWIERLPHRRASLAAPVAGTGIVEFEAPDASPVVIATARRAEDLPSRCGLVIAVGVGGPATLSERGGEWLARELQPDFVSLEDAAAFAGRLRDRAERENLVPARAGIPPAVSFESVERPPSPDDGHNNSLGWVIGRGALGIHEIDLVDDGPHAVVGGTTGSGKSELLVTGILSVAARYPPRRVTFLLVDFKGGASFGPVRSLPHCVGLITDLDSAGALRALESLRAELAFRERMLAEAGAKSIDTLPPSAALARLVIVVDEFAVLANDFPDLRALFADLAARGRSLGVHLVLCTQRPADALRDAILANCTLRIALRLNSAADSLSLIGTSAAAELPRFPAGRALVALPGEAAIEVQVALSDSSDAARVAAAWPADPEIRRPWCEPLPALLNLDRIESVPGEFVFGLTDLPDEQRQEVAVYRPGRQGNVLVQGAQRSGKTAAIRALAAGAPAARFRLVPDDPEGAWDAVAQAVRGLEQAPGEPVVLAIDDADALVERFGRDHQLEFIDLLSRLLRDGPGRATTVVLAAQRVPAVLRTVTELCESRLLLRLPTREDHLVARGRGDQFDRNLPAGGGFWLGHRIQVGWLPPMPLPEPPRPAAVTLPLGAATAVVSTSPRETVARLAALSDTSLRTLRVAEGPADGRLLVSAAGTHTLIVGDPQEWSAAWAILGSVRRSTRMLFHGCSVGEFRAVTGSRRLPPPLADGRGSVWLLSPDDALTRARLG